MSHTPKLAKVCAVVGVGPGLGNALCRRFGQEGFEIAMIARSLEGLEPLRQTLHNEGIRAHAFTADAGDSASLRQAFDDIGARLGAPEILIYNVSTVHPAYPSELSEKAFLSDLQVNVVGALTAAKLVLPAMVERNLGTLLLTGSGAGVRPWADHASLSVGKAALRMLALNLAAELNDTSVYVATVTIRGGIGQDERFAPERLAEVFWQAHQEQDQAQSEIVYS
jgi:short-subunit dehydrogenase